MNDSVNHRIMIVDDDNVFVSVIEGILKTAFDTGVANSGPAALDALTERLPEVVLLDISMPGGIDGYETCRQLRARLPADEQPAVIFMSSLDSLDARLEAYESGGDDFMIKPVSPKEVLLKVRAMLSLVAQRKRFKAQADSASQIAMSFLANLGEVGTALQFMRNSLSCQDFAGLASLAIATLHEYGLEANIQLRTPEARLTFAESGQASPLEESVFDMLKDLERVFQFRKRIVVNYPHVSVLVKNLPTEDEERCGRLRDLLVTIAEGCESSMLSLIRIAEIEARKRQVHQASEDIRAAVDSLHRQYKEQQTEARLVLLQMREKVVNELAYFGLTELQEGEMLALFDTTIEETLHIFEFGRDFSKKLDQVLENCSA